MRMTEEQWDAVINVNLKSVFNFTKAVSAINAETEKRFDYQHEALLSA